jgi:hypothetical protein
MKVDKILLSYAGANFLFMAGGIILLVGSLLFSQAVNSTPTLDSAPSILLLKMVPEKGMLWKCAVGYTHELTDLRA